MKSNKQRRAELQAKRDKKLAKAEAVRREQASLELDRLRALGRVVGRNTVLPPGAVAADLKQQVPWNSYSAAPLFYEDIAFKCLDCGCDQIWTAEQQKWWYEVAKGSLYTRAVRCRECRQKRRASGGD